MLPLAGEEDNSCNARGVAPFKMTTIHLLKAKSFPNIRVIKHNAVNAVPK